VKVYTLTKKGRVALDRERESWRLFAGAVEAILATA